MSKLASRLDRLERQQAKQGQRRCANCRSWNRTHVLNIDVDGNESWEDPDAPDRCTRCGWVSMVIRVIEVRDWERVGKHGIR